MDFHTLSRRDLQFLCKKNKIPANITNLAMADALHSLPTVEGLEELLAHPGADYPETPAKSMTATPGVGRTSKLTTRTRQVKNDVPKAAPPSACAKPSIARSTQRKVESSAVMTTRRSTRLLEKQMDQLSLKDNEETVDSSADLNKDSQDMQRQFSEDMDNSLADESNVTTEAVEEPVSVGNKTDEPVNMDAALDLEKECKNDEDQPMQEDVAEQMDIVSHPNMNGVADEVSHPIAENAIAVVVDISISAVQTDETQMVMDEVTQEEVVVSAEETQEEVVVVNSEETREEVVVVSVEETHEEVVVVSAEETHGEVVVVNAEETQEEVVVVNVDETLEEVDPQTKLEEHADKGEEISLQAPEFMDDEFDFLSESEESEDDSDINQEEVDQLVENDDDMVDAEPAASRSPLMLPREQSASKSTVDQVVPITDNKENFQMKSASEARTPLEKKSLRQLKRMVKLLAAEKKQQADEMQPAPLQLHAENV